jgi:hypothetical protein
LALRDFVKDSNQAIYELRRDAAKIRASIRASPCRRGPSSLQQGIEHAVDGRDDPRRCLV